MKLNNNLHEQMIDLLVSGNDRWTGTPEEFLEAMQMAHGMMKQQVLQENPDMVHEVLPLPEMAEMFMALLAVDLSPYKDFQDLQKNARTSGSFREKLKTGLINLEMNNVLHEVREAGISPVPQTQAGFNAGDLMDEALARKIENYRRKAVAGKV